MDRYLNSTSAPSCGCTGLWFVMPPMCCKIFSLPHSRRAMAHRFMKFIVYVLCLKGLYGNTVDPQLSDPLLSKFSIIQPQTHSPNSIYACYFRHPIIRTNFNLPRGLDNRGFTVIERKVLGKTLGYMHTLKAISCKCRLGICFILTHISVYNLLHFVLTAVCMFSFGLL